MITLPVGTVGSFSMLSLCSVSKSIYLCKESLHRYCTLEHMLSHCELFVIGITRVFFSVVVSINISILRKYEVLEKLECKTLQDTWFSLSFHDFILNFSFPI